MPIRGRNGKLTAGYLISQLINVDPETEIELYADYMQDVSIAVGDKEIWDDFYGIPESILPREKTVEEKLSEIEGVEVELFTTAIPVDVRDAIRSALVGGVSEELHIYFDDFKKGSNDEAAPEGIHRGDEHTSDPNRGGDAGEGKGEVHGEDGVLPRGLATQGEDE